jgi:hypothetical protein
MPKSLFGGMKLFLLNVFKVLLDKFKSKNHHSQWQANQIYLNIFHPHLFVTLVSMGIDFPMSFNLMTFCKQWISHSGVNLKPIN